MLNLGYMVLVSNFQPLRDRINYVPNGTGSPLKPSLYYKHFVPNGTYSLYSKLKIHNLKLFKDVSFNLFTMTKSILFYEIPCQARNDEKILCGYAALRCILLLIFHFFQKKC
jgi:hypothetical protein